MVRSSCKLIPAIIFLLAVVSNSGAQDEMMVNPYYKFWASFKPGDKAVHLETTRVLGADGKIASGPADEKRIAYKLLKVDPERVVVEMVVTEKDFLGYVEAAPTKYIYPAKHPKADLERIYQSIGDKSTEEVLKIDGKEIKTKVVAGTVKNSENELIDFKLWLSDDVPGTIVKQVRTARVKGEAMAETNILLKSYKKADKAE